MDKKELLGNVESSRKIFLWVQTGMFTGIYLPLSAEAAYRLVTYMYAVQQEEKIDLFNTCKADDVLYIGVVNEQQ